MDVRSAAERAVALAASGATESVVATLRPLRALPAEKIEIGDGAAHATIFPLRRGTGFPLHDHPAMTVVCKVLHGRLLVDAYEWTDRGGGVARPLGLREVDDGADPLVFGPEPGTLHRITALTDCAFIDVFAPYYDDARPCRYYRLQERRGDGLVLLEPTGELAP